MKANKTTGRVLAGISLFLSLITFLGSIWLSKDLHDRLVDTGSVFLILAFILWVVTDLTD
jgi:hypothetical protein